MTHDKFCPMAVPHIPSFMCICDVIAKVRVDEREQAAQRIQELVFDALGQASMAWSEVPSGVFDSKKCAELGEQIIAAVRGEQA